MRERGILFSAPMVLALLAGRKTQTRRVAKPQPDGTVNGAPYWQGAGVKFAPGGFVPSAHATPKCPYGKPGDRLWVRETWRPFACSDDATATMHIEYRADNGSREHAHCVEFEHVDFHAAHDKYIAPALTTERDGDEERMFIDPDKNPWRPGIFMPRWASRLTLEITDVRVERVQEISEEDALAEGFAPSQDRNGDKVGAADNFLTLFYDINKRAPRTSNPWVWVLTFKSCKA